MLSNRHVSDEELLKMRQLVVQGMTQIMGGSVPSQEGVLLRVGSCA